MLLSCFYDMYLHLNISQFGKIFAARPQPWLPVTAAELAAVGLLHGEGDGAADPEPGRLVRVAPRPLPVTCRGWFAVVL